MGKRRGESCHLDWDRWRLSSILVIFFIVFGAGKLPQVGEAIGRGLRFLRGGKGKGKDKEEETKTAGRSKKKVIRKIED